MTQDAADFVNSLTPEQQATFVTFCKELIDVYSDIKQRLITSDGNESIDPFAIVDACYVSLGEPRSDPRNVAFCIDPKVQLSEQSIRKEVTALVFVKDMAAWKDYMADNSDEVAFNALIAEAALELISGSNALHRVFES